MITIVDVELRREARKYAFRFGCENCLHFDVQSALCVNGYPVEPHFSIDLQASDALSFCKEFELG